MEDNERMSASVPSDGRAQPGEPAEQGGEATASWVRALAGRGLGLSPASHTDTVQRATRALGAGPVEWAIELGYQMNVRLLHEIPALGEGDFTFDELRSGPESAVLQSLLLVTVNDPGLSRATPEALEGNRDFVPRGIPLDQLLRGIRLAHSHMAGAMLAAIAELVPEPAATAEMKRTSELLFGFIDDFSSMMTAEYLVERDRWVAGTVAARVEVVQAILNGTGIDPVAAGATLAYPLDRSHIALVLRKEGDVGTSVSMLQDTAAKVLGRLGCRATLLIPQGGSTLWAWGGRSSFPPEMPATEEIVRQTAITVGLGGPGRGITGFRGSHGEAVRAVALAQGAAPGPAGRVICYRKVDLIALLASDAEMAAAFVVRELGPLAERSRAAADLRLTLAAYLDTERSLVRAAERLHVARNTVAYRVHKAEDLLRRDLRERTIELQCALRLAEMLPATVLPADDADK